MILEAADNIAKTLVEALSPYCVHCKVAGSVRRRKPEVKDIEIVSLVKTDLDAMRAVREIVNHRWGSPSIGHYPSRYTRIRGAYNLDLFWPHARNFGWIYFVRTGPDEFVHRALGYWKKLTNGGYGEDGMLHLADGTPVETPDEETVFKLLGCKFIAPERRLRTCEKK